MKIADFVANEIGMNASRLQGLSYLYRNFNSAGSCTHDEDARYGIGLFLEDLACSCRRLAKLSEDANGFPDLELDIDWDKPDL